MAQLYHASSPKFRHSTRWAIPGAEREWLRTCSSSTGVSSPRRSRYSAQKAKDSSTCDGALRITSLLPPPQNRSAGPSFLTSKSVEVSGGFGTNGDVLAPHVFTPPALLATAPTSPHQWHPSPTRFLPGGFHALQECGLR